LHGLQYCANLFLTSSLPVSSYPLTSVIFIHGHWLNKSDISYLKTSRAYDVLIQLRQAKRCWLATL